MLTINPIAEKRRIENRLFEKASSSRKYSNAMSAAMQMRNNMVVLFVIKTVNTVKAVRSAINSWQLIVA
ncbi:MAG: hypothetical protein JWP69_1418 [Flaviaesturariibacter sp.]|nr:hypothetical protein [Flaviaesturariibacter sp.]